MTVAEIKAELLRRAEEFARYLFPQGEREGNHWCVGDISGVPGKSFKVCVAGDKTGLWGDFAAGGHHQGLIDLWMEKHQVDFKTALSQCAEWLGVTIEGTTESQPASLFSSIDDQPPKRVKWRPYAMTEDELHQCETMRDALLRNERAIYGIAKSRGWKPDTIRNLVLNRCLGLHEGKLVYIYSTGAKQRLRPLTPALAEQHTGAPFIWLFGKPHALWRGDELLRCKDRAHISEGETAAISLIDAGVGAGLGEVVVATPGASTWRDEWAAGLNGLHVTLWPDADAAGEKHARQIVESLHGVAASIERVDLTTEVA
jgi:hypothetical protein